MSLVSTGRGQGQVFDALGSALISMIPVVGDLAEIREINRDPNRSTLNKAVNTTGIILIGFVPPAKVVKVGGKLIKTADKIDDLADAAKTLDRVSDAADAVKDGDRAKDAAKAADKVKDTGECAKTASGGVKFKKWERGQRIDKPLPDGSEPDWDTVRSRYWKNRYDAAKDTGEFSKENLRRMNKGQAPLDYNPRTGRFESRELHHVKPQRDGGPNSPENLREVTPDQHRALDEHRR